MKPKSVWILAGIGVFLILLLTGVVQRILEGIFGVIAFAFVAAIWLIPLALAAWVVVRLLGAKERRRKLHTEAKLASVSALVARFGDNPETQVVGINKTFDERSETLRFDFNYIGTGGANQKIAARIERSLATMPSPEREALRTALLMFVRGQNRNLGNTWKEVANLIYGEGKGTVYSGSTYIWPGSDTSDIQEGIRWAVGEKTEPMINLILTELNEAVLAHPDDPVLKVLTARITGNGKALETPAVVTPIDPAAPQGNALILGADDQPDGVLRGYAGEGHLITIAPSRMGKSQCHVIPNLLTWDGPAVVLDIKNELYAATAGWRAANVGPVFKFSPLTPDDSHHYNPLAEVSDDLDFLWEDAGLLASMLIVPKSQKEPFWEEKARDLVQAAIAHTIYMYPPGERSMSNILNIVHGLDWERFIAGLTSTDDPEMMRAAASLGEIEPRLRDSIRQTANTSLQCWGGRRITKSTATSDWHPSDLKGPGKPTIYICLRPNEVERYIPMLRVLIAQHIRSLVGVANPARDQQQVLFLLDEFPQLRAMKPVEEALEIGAQYGIKIWMFAQNMSQMENTYERADGMVGGCAVRCFMNPGMQDGLAQKLSDQLGYRDSVLDGSRVKVVEPNVLAGPDFKDRILVTATSALPGVLTKRPAHLTPVFVERMKIAPPPIERSVR
jgi:type IV secretion system protein VirD4